MPRQYVTGESVEDSLAFLRDRLLPEALERPFTTGQALGLAGGLVSGQEADSHPAAICALETALLDLAGRAQGRPLSAWLGGQARASLTYSGVLPLTSLAALERLLGVVAALGLNEVKVKAGREDDLERVGLARRVLGPEARLRVDANGAWGVDEALAKAESLARLGVESIEQPVPAADLEGLLEVARRAAPLVIADESLCTLAQARHLAASGARVGFNLRLSKCGGFARTLEILRLARGAGLPCQLGCQVGELGLLSAAGRHFASACPDLLHLEGSLAGFYLERDLVERDLTFGPGGLAPALSGAGLGVEVDESRLHGCQVFSLP